MVNLLLLLTIKQTKENCLPIKGHPRFFSLHTLILSPITKNKLGLLYDGGVNKLFGGALIEVGKCRTV